MKKYAVSDLVKEVKVILDRNQENAELIPDDTDTISQGEIVRSVMVDAAKVIEEHAPAVKLDTIRYLLKDVDWTKDKDVYIGKATLPDNILRMVSVKASDWVRPSVVISETDDAYPMQSNRYIRGNRQRPVAVLSHVNGARTLELYSSKDNTATADMSYIPVPAVDDDGYIEICSLLKDAVLYMAAYLTCITLGDTQTAEGYRATAYQLAGIVEPSQT